MANPEDLGRYRLKRLLGRGARGEVWEATDLEQRGATVAVKIMHAPEDELALARVHFAREARLASLLHHPNVAAVHDAGEAAGTSFMVMDMVEGESLRKVGGDPKTTLAEKLCWLRQIGDGLSAMHRVGVVHRDLKPENVIVRPDRTACVVDLGIAKWTRFELGDFDETDVVERVGGRPPVNADYVPPETNEECLYDELGDQYAWGILAYEVLTGAAPHADSPPLTEREDIPLETAAAIDRARSRNREDRWDGMDFLLDELVDRTSARPKPGRPAVGVKTAPMQSAFNRAEPPRLLDAAPRKTSALRLAGGLALAALVFILVGLIAAVLR